jgi:hypothetical protein
VDPTCKARYGGKLCTPCPANTYSIGGYVDCNFCPAGYVSTGKSDQCSQCQSGKYQNENNPPVDAECKPQTSSCTAGHFLTDPDPTTDRTCVACSQGQYQTSMTFEANSCVRSSNSSPVIIFFFFFLFTSSRCHSHSPLTITFISLCFLLTELLSTWILQRDYNRDVQSVSRWQVPGRG